MTPDRLLAGMTGMGGGSLMTPIPVVILELAGITLRNVPGAGTIVMVVLSAGAVGLLVWLGRHSWIRFVRGRGAAASVAE